MARADDTELIDAFEEFYRSYYRNEIAELAQKYPSEQRSLYVDWQDLYRFDSALADDFRNKPQQLQRYAEEALRLYDLPVDVSLGQAHVRVTNLPEKTDIRAIRADHRGMLLTVQGIIRKATDVRPKITTAAFECQRCGTLTRIPQETGDFQEPHECQGCERQGPFRINYDQSEFIDAQKLRVQESPEGLRGGETPQSIDVNIEDDITGDVTAGDHVSVTGVLQLDQRGNEREKSPMFDIYMDGMTVEIEDEEFEEMDITDEDKKEIVELSNSPDIYEQMRGAIAPSIYGYEREKLAMVFQLFSGVTKHLPDGSRTRGDLHMLLIGDPGTGKCVSGDTRVRLADGSSIAIETLVETRLDDPTPVDDGVYDDVDISLPSLTEGGEIETKTATKVWKREAPEKMYRIHTACGREIEVTPSHPLFIPAGGEYLPVRAENLAEGDDIAVCEWAEPDGGHVISQSSGGVRGIQNGTGSRGTVEVDEITEIDTVEPGYGWVYDLEVAGTHTYVSEGFVSHNSQLLQYVNNIAPRSVYTSGKGSSAAGLCVTGDTMIHTPDGLREIREIVEDEIEESVTTETAVERAVPVYTFDRDNNVVEPRATSHVWRMPEKPCRQLQTGHGTELEASVNTPVLTREKSGTEWKQISDIEEGEFVAVPDYKGDGTEKTVNATLVWDEVVDATDTGNKEVFDITVPETHNFIGNGIVTHNTAAAVRDDFGDGQQWSLEAGALVLADRGIAAVDELDKMRPEDQSAMHEALEQQSYHPDTEILLADGRRVPIGEFVDERMDAQPDNVVDGVDCEILPVDDVGVHTVDFDTNETTKTDVDRLSRHEAPDEFVRVTFSNGRDVTVTPEHPMFVEDSGDVGTVAARELTEGAFVPAPRKLPNSAATVHLDDEPHCGRENDIELPEKMTPKLAEILGFLTATGYAGSSHEIGFSNRDERLPERMEELMSTVFGMRSTETTTEAETVTKRWVSTELYRWFERNVPELMTTARHKRIPATVLGASEELIRQFLIGAFQGDGGVGSEAMAFSTASEGLAHDYADALSKIGVSSRIHYSESEDSWKTYVMDDGNEMHDVETEGYGEQRRAAIQSDAREAIENVLAEAENRTDQLNSQTDLRYYRVTDVETVPNDDTEWVYDVTVEPTNTFVSQGVILHNSISISKAGINATLKSRCSLLGAANPRMGRFDRYEPIGEQIDLEPPLISRFDLIFIVTDDPDEEEDAELAEHILRTNYAGELNTHRTENATSNYTKEEVERVTDEVAPTIEPEFFRKYVAYAKRNCFPTMTEEAMDEIRDFYVQLRSRGTDEDAPVPVTARKLEALVRLAESSARVRLSDTVELEDARRGIDIAQYCLEEIGMDPETGELDADMIETGTSKSQRDRIKDILNLIEHIEEEYDEGAPVDVIVERAEEAGVDPEKAEHEIDQLKQKGEVYEPQQNYLRTT